MRTEMRKRIIMINLCVAAVLAVIAGSFAAYTSLSSAKRVVSTTGSNQLFSSNVLYPYEREGGSPSTRVMSFSTDTETNTFRFTVCNYAQGDKTAWAVRNISYELTVTLLTASGVPVTDADVLDAYKLDGTSFSACSTLQKTLAYDSTQVTEDSYTITIPTEYMNDYRIRIIASADVEAYKPLGRVISTTESETSSHWSGTFTDAIVDDANQVPAALGSVNTRISGRENEIMVITWETDYVEIDPWFLEDLGNANYTITEDKDKHTKTIKFEVGGENQPNQYYISFYRTTSAKTLDETWTQMKAHIAFGYESKTTT
jgi:hypothetical protein